MTAKLKTTLPDHLDVLIVGAGISGIGSAYYLQERQPNKSYAIIEARDDIGGTWDLFRYPGIRSDSDLFTFAYAFKPWKNDQAIASGQLIMDYLRETVRENGIDRHIHFRHKLVHAAWSTRDARWLVDMERTDTGERVQVSCGWLVSASGYYRYDQGFTPEFAGRDRFQGQVIHPQFWPENLDYSGKKVVVIGSGATAVTLVPAMADKAAHITMLQRTPTYVMPVPLEDPIAKVLRDYLPENMAYKLTRGKNILLQKVVFDACQRFPQQTRQLIRYVNSRYLPKDYPVDQHFNPPYAPWEQRLCSVPDGDLFKTLNSGRASIVTDHIAHFTETGIQLQSGQHLDADIIVTATGLKLQIFGGASLSVDGVPVNVTDKVAYRGMMLNGVPNFSFIIGYTNSSWTLKVGILCEQWCKLLSYMDNKDYAICRPEISDVDMQTRPLLDFGAGYVKRAVNDLPRQGSRAPWLMSMSYVGDLRLLKSTPLVDRNLHFSKRNKHRVDSPSRLTAVASA